MTASSRDLLARRTALVAARAEFGKRAEELAEAMADAEAQGITRAAIARGTGLSRSRVSQILGPRVSAVPAHTPHRIVPLRGRSV